MFNNFVNLEKSLDFMESLENKKLAKNEKLKLLNKIHDMQKYIESLEEIIESQKQKEADKKGHLKHKSMMSGTSKNSNFSHTRIMNTKNAELYNIDEYGYGEGEELGDKEKNLENLDLSS
jgi:hypothetical protein